MNEYLGYAIFLIFVFVLILFTVQMLRIESVNKIKAERDMYKTRSELLSKDILRIGREKKELYETLVAEKNKIKKLIESRVKAEHPHLYLNQEVNNEKK